MSDPSETMSLVETWLENCEWQATFATIDIESRKIVNVIFIIARY